MPDYFSVRRSWAEKSEGALYSKLKIGESEIGLSAT